MAQIFRPSIWRPSTSGTTGTVVNSGRLYELPQPVISLQSPISWKGETTTGPYVAGATGVYGQVRDVVPISCSGTFGTQDGDATMSESEMWLNFYTLQAFMEPVTPTSLFEFFLYYDLATTTYVKFKSVRFLNLTSNQGDTNWNLFPWDISAEALDPVIYTTSPGA